MVEKKINDDRLLWVETSQAQWKHPEENGQTKRLMVAPSKVENSRTDGNTNVNTDGNTRNEANREKDQR
jgi:hypothetical protein